MGAVHRWVLRARGRLRSGDRLDDMVEVAGSLGEQLGAALRTERFLRSTSQRALARELGVSKSFIGRLESGDLRGSAAAVARLVEALGLVFAIVVPDEGLATAWVDDAPEDRHAAPSRDAGRPGDGASPYESSPPSGDFPADGRPPTGATPTPTDTGDGTAARCLDRPDPSDGPGDDGGSAADQVGSGDPPSPAALARRVVVGTPAALRPLRMDRFYDDPVAQVVAQSWIRRADGEDVRDAAGRRMPAHVVCFPVQLPRTWWPCRHPGWRWEHRPVWSWQRHPLWVREVRLTGPNPDPVGAHPTGGYPMQGHPSEATRGDWPPDPSTPAGRALRRQGGTT